MYLNTITKSTFRVAGPFYLELLIKMSFERQQIIVSQDI